MSIAEYIHSLKEPYINREISWLAFNERVMQEAEDKDNPLIERLKFLGIFSNNLDEFFRVRVATLKRMVKYKGSQKDIVGGTPDDILKLIQNIAIKQRRRFEKNVREIISELEKHQIYLLDENQLDKEQGEYVRDFFLRNIRSHLTPIMLMKKNEFPQLKDKKIYLAVKLFFSAKEDSSSVYQYAIIELPTEMIPRFVVLPEKNNKKFVMWVDDIIRYNLKEIFYIIPHKDAKAYTVKVTRDAELDMDNDVSKSIIELVSKSVKKREKGAPVRFLYDEEMPDDLLQFLKKSLNISKIDNTIAGTRYHNSKDFMNFPDMGQADLVNKPYPPLLNKKLNNYESIFSILQKQDVLLSFPYESFTHLIDVLREAAIDPKVRSIKITLYRVAKHSAVVNALLNAVRNGKEVVVVMELQARFDEESNIYWSNKLIEEGANVIHGVKGLKVHSKLFIITREENNGLKYYVNIGTGNYNEVTSTVFSDLSLLTANQQIAAEVNQVFDFFNQNYKSGKYKHLLVAPFFMRDRISALILQEIEYAEKGKNAYIYMKLNNLVDQKIIDLLYKAGKAGVKVKLFVRGTCSLIAGLKGVSDNIECTAIIDKFLEHSRVFVFGGGGKQKVYIGSADMMKRNLDYRVEVLTPIYDKRIQIKILKFLDFESKDHVKTRSLHYEDFNRYRRNDTPPNNRTQIEIYKYLKKENA
ncbi:MAG: polyphosphate kinase 1 [Chitinophagaceae bacterium]|nr:MAG: polyphosphate kinase 1 [Chitinophagaceae bacterium]